MKNLLLIGLIPAMLFGFTACGDSEEEAVVEEIEFKDAKEKRSFAFGVENASGLLKETRFDALDKQMVIEGFKANLSATPPTDCEATIQKFLGPQGMDFDTTYLLEGSKCIGRFIGFEFHSQMTGIGQITELDLDMVKKGFEQGLLEQDTVNLTVVERTQIMTDFQKEMNDNFMSEIEEKDNIFWQDVLSKPGVEQIGETGVYLETIKGGSGGSPDAMSDFEAHYILTNALGDTLESSYVGGAPLKMNLSQVIAGWQIGFPAMKKGGKYRLFVPWEKAYKGGRPDAPQGALCFFVEFINYGEAGSLAPAMPQY
ncbi:MAG: FKBP-type peptidyl-prolyl cis-trans isomerase [Crocinitomicaceae bacterium]